MPNCFPEPKSSIDPDLNYYDNLPNSCLLLNPHSDIISLTSHKISCLHINIRSAQANLDDLKAFLNTYKLHFTVIVLTETWLESDTEFADLTGYIAYHTIRTTGCRGGVSVLISDALSVSGIQCVKTSNNLFESCSLTLNLTTTKLNITGVYRRPNTSIKDFNSLFFSSPNLSFSSNSISTICLLYTSPSPRDKRQSRMPSSA